MLLIMGVGIIGYFFGDEIYSLKEKVASEVTSNLCGEKDDFLNVQSLDSGQGFLKNNIVGLKANPFYPENKNVEGGPHDVFGFRNWSVPHSADVITIGDSQTYGLYALINKNWPSVTGKILSDDVGRKVEVYNMSVSGFGAIQYRYLLQKAMMFRPKIIIVALYTGNDAYETFDMAKSEYWKDKIRKPDMENIELPSAITPSENNTWKVKFSDGNHGSFHPKYRLIPNDTRNKAIQIGFDLIGAFIREASSIVGNEHVAIYFTIIPTKELVYKNKIYRDIHNRNAVYDELIMFEERNIANLKKIINKTEGVKYIDVIEALQTHALSKQVIYPFGEGHPNKYGYAVIGKQIANSLSGKIPNIHGFIRLSIYHKLQLYYVHKGEAIKFYSDKILRKIGAKSADIPTLSYDIFAGIRLKKVVDDELVMHSSRPKLMMLLHNFEK